MNRTALRRLLGSTRARLVAVLALATVVIGVLAVQAADSSLSYYVTPEEFASMGKNTPIAGRELRGRVLATVYGGRVVHTLEGVAL